MSISYIHPQEDQILSQALDIMKRSETAAGLIGKEQSIRVMTGPISQGFTPDGKRIYLRVPAMQNVAQIEQALDLAATLYECQILQKDGVPQKNQLETDDVLRGLHERNVRIIVKIFDIAQELDDSGYHATAELRKMGFSKMLNAWKTSNSIEECANIYWNMNNNQ